MTITDIANLRLQNEHLSGRRLDSPVDVVQWFGAVQSQDYYGAKWALAQRSNNCFDADIDRAYNDGKILRTHVLRPTWHFVAPEDIRWIQMLTAPRVNAFCKYYFKRLDLDDKTFQKSNEVLAKALQGGKQLTRPELKQAYETAGINASGLRLAYLVLRGELDALICSGALRGKQHTYALVDERAPKAQPLSRNEALAELTKRYFTSHGPAQIQDFAWWSSLTVADIKKGLDLAKPKLKSETVDGKTFWFAEATSTPGVKSPNLMILPNYDEFLIAYKDHSPSVDPHIKPMDVGSTNIVFGNHIIVLDGRAIGGWRRKITKNAITIETKLLLDLNKAQTEALKHAAAEYGTFLGLTPKLVSSNS